MNRLGLILLASSAACGARSTLEDREAAVGTTTSSSSSAGSGARGVGGEGGALPACDEVSLTALATSDLVLDGVSIFGAELAPARDDPDRACAAGAIAQQAPGDPFGMVCFDAFGVWPRSLGAPSPIAGTTNGGIAVARGRSSGIAVLTGQVNDPFASGARFASDVLPLAAPAWTDLAGFTTHRAQFLAQTKADAYVAGLIFEALPYRYLNLYRFESGGRAELASAVACSNGPLVSDAVVGGPEVYLATSSTPVGTCLQDTPGPATSLKVFHIENGSVAVISERVFDVPLDRIRAADAGDSYWVGSSAAGAIRVSRHLKTGGLPVDQLVVSEASPGAFDVAVRGDEVFVAYLDASDPDLGADVMLAAIGPNGERRPLGGFDTSEAPWAADLSLLVSDDAKHIVVAYATNDGRVAARRFECLTD